MVSAAFNAIAGSSMQHITMMFYFAIQASLVMTHHHKIKPAG